METLQVLQKVFGFEPNILSCSQFLNTDEYKGVFKEILSDIHSLGLEDLVRDTIPEMYQENQSAYLYTLHEIACVEYLQRTLGIETKIGPDKEKQYDLIMKRLGMDLSFGYLIDAYAVGSRVPEKVVHYVPTHRGTTNGQRIFFDDVMYISKNRSQMGPETASRYLLTVASLAGQILGKDYFTQDYIRRLKGKKLRRKARRLVIDNIIKPYRNAMDEQ